MRKSDFCFEITHNLSQVNKDPILKDLRIVDNIYPLASLFNDFGGYIENPVDYLIQDLPVFFSIDINHRYLYHNHINYSNFRLRYLLETSQLRGSRAYIIGYKMFYSNKMFYYSKIGEEIIFLGFLGVNGDLNAKYLKAKIIAKEDFELSVLNFYRISTENMVAQIIHAYRKRHGINPEPGYVSNFVNRVFELLSINLAGHNIETIISDELIHKMSIPIQVSYTSINSYDNYLLEIKNNFVDLYKESLLKEDISLSKGESIIDKYSGSSGLNTVLKTGKESQEFDELKGKIVNRFKYTVRIRTTHKLAVRSF